MVKHDTFSDYVSLTPIDWRVEIVTPDGEWLRPNASLVELATTEGQIGVMPGHQPLLTTLELGELVVHDGDERTVFLVGGGFASITPERLSVLAFSLERKLDEPARRRCEARRKEWEN
jgi:F-type H+-transporting ATPase subunit epsilon